MAIIRNDRDRRAGNASSDEDLLDPTWYPTEDEFVSPITDEQWLTLLRDPSFANTDAAMGLRRLYDYGEPATFQEMSIRYNSTMGKHRRWLSEAAQLAGERYGVPAPRKDQFGADEWWPLLYRVRAAGKPGAGVYKMQLRPEVERAFQMIEEDKLQEKRAEEVRRQQRQEKMDKALKAERERKAAEAAAAAAAKAEAQARAQAAAAPAPAPEPSEVPVPTQPQLAYLDDARPASSGLKALDDFLALVDGEEEPRILAASSNGTPPDVAAPIDYTLRYAERLRGMLALIRVGYAPISAAHVAREAGDESMEYLQAVLNGKRLPGFSYIDRIEQRLFVNHEYLEAPDGTEDVVPAFCTYAEVRKAHPSLPPLDEDLPTQIAYVVDDTREGRTAVVLRFSAARCALLTRVPVQTKSRRAKNERLDAFLRMVDELDELSRANGIARTSHNVDAATWDELVAGIVWPGTVLE